MRARLASPEAFKEAGIEYLPSMAGIRFAIEKRKGGQPYLRLTTVRPVNDPFLDVLVEVNWASGRLVREYTMLLDPPEVLGKVTPVAVPKTKRAPAEVAPPSEATATARPVPTPRAPSPVAETKPTESLVVKKGDTLAKIAAATKPEGVSLDQMLVALFRTNEREFDGGNMNRLRAGKILAVPDAASAASITPDEARKVIVVQSQDFDAYRRKLGAVVAAAPVAKEDAAKQAAAGKIAPKVDERAPAPVPSQDKLEVSRTEAAKEGKALQGRITALEEDLVSRDRALNEARGRISELEKNLGDLKKLAEVKSQGGSQLQQQSEAAKPPKPTEPVKKAAGAPVEIPAAPMVETPKPADVPKAQEAPRAVEAPKAPEVPVVPESAKTPPRKPPVTPPPAAEPSFIEENPALVYGGGGIIALLLAYLGFKSRRSKQQAMPTEGLATTSRLSEGALMANSVFGSTGGQAVDTSGAASIQTDFSQPSLAAIDADEGVDPVAEADVYMAYGRDAQAEEILLDALKNDPARRAIHLKLIEIYSARKNVKQLESVATDLHGLTDGKGPDWEKAAAMGRALDAGNPLYAAPAVAAEPDEAPAELAVREEPVSMPEILTPAVEPEEPAVPVVPTVPAMGIAAVAAAVPVGAVAAEELRPQALGVGLEMGIEPYSVAPAAAEAVTPGMLDFDLELGPPEAAPSVVTATPAEEALARSDFGSPLTEPVPEAPMAAPQPVGELGAFDLSMPEDVSAPMPSVALEETATPVAETKEGMDFEFDLEMPAETVAVAEPSIEELPPLDLSGIDLDLGVPLVAPAPAMEGGAPKVAEYVPPAFAVEGEEENSDVATKLELAQAYEEMGDKEGARELLQEVIHEGSTHQQELARAKLAALDA